MAKPMEDYGKRTARLAGRIDQLVGWAKTGQRPVYPARARIYILDAEKTNRLRDDIIDVIVAEFTASLGAIFPDTLRQQVQRARDIHYQQALDYGEMSGPDYWEREERAYGRVEALDEVLGWLAPEGEK